MDCLGFGGSRSRYHGCRSNSAKNAEQTAKEIQEMGRKSIPAAVDVADVEAVTRMMYLAKNELGGLDILVNNAGVNVHKRALDITGRILILSFE